LDSGGRGAANRFRCMCPEIMSRLASRPAESVIRMQLEVWKVESKNLKNGTSDGHTPTGGADAPGRVARIWRCQATAPDAGRQKTPSGTRSSTMGGRGRPKWRCVPPGRPQPLTHANRWCRRSRPSRTDLRHVPLFRAASSQWGPRMLPEALAPSRQDDAKSRQAMQPSRKGRRSFSSPTSDSAEPVPVGLDICISVSICHIYSLSLLHVFTISKKY